MRAVQAKKTEIGSWSSNELAVIKDTVNVGPAGFFLGESIPEPQCLVTSTCDDRFTVRTHGQVQDTIGMPRQRCNHTEGWIFPYANLVLGGSR